MSTIIESFWSGAVKHHDQVDLQRMHGELGSWQAVEQADAALLVHYGAAPEVARAWLATPPTRTEGHVIRMRDDGYPARLVGIPDAPPVLFVEGDSACLEGPSIGMVGTRSCSSYGRAVASQLAGDLAAVGVTVVSGLARGIDAAAHRAANDSGRTIAVLGHGLGRTSPTSNKFLRKKIGDQGGLVLSTWHDDVRPTRFTFPRRNRWIAALSDAVVVVEAPIRSGALITARQANDLSRDVYAVPGPINEPASAGTNHLIASGAQPLNDVRTFVADIAGKRIDDPELWVSVLLGGGTVDDASRCSGRPTVELLRQLSLMELRGELVRLPGGRYARARGTG